MPRPVSGQQNAQTVRSVKLLFLGVVLLALAARSAATWRWREELRRDRDGYRAIAENVVHHGIFSADGRSPTAYRPPLSPLFLAGHLWAGGEAAVAVTQILLGTATVVLTYLLGRRFDLKSAAVWAAGLVAVDPLLLRYTPQLMTETLFTFLLTMLMWLVTKKVESRKSKDEGMKKPECPKRVTPAFGIRHSGFFRHLAFPIRHSLAVGLVFGLCALCRPTVWAFAAAGGVVWVGRSLWGVRKPTGRNPWDSGRNPWALVHGAVIAAVAMVTVSPWVVRNWIVFDRPIVMTTHGGYTLLLGNNPVFYDEVVRKKWGTVWDGESLNRWQRSLETAMQNADPPPQTEPQRDRWHFQRAVENISADPAGFFSACWLRLRRFWNVVPLTDAGENLPGVLRWAIGAFYTLITAGMLLGLVRLRRSEWRRWWPIVVLIVSFTAVHLLYWSNMRMRAPLIPVIALLAVRGVVRRSNSESPADEPPQRRTES